MTVEEAQERTNQSMSFAVQHFYSPELDWKVGVQKGKVGWVDSSAGSDRNCIVGKVGLLKRDIYWTYIQPT